MKIPLPSGVSQSVAWKLILPTPVFAVIAVLSVWWFVPSMVEQNVREDAVRAAAQTAGQFKTIRGYYTQNVVKKVLANGGLKPSYNHKTEKDTIPLPATLIHDMSELLAEADTTVNLYSLYPFPVRGDRKLDEFQNDAWAFLSATADRNFVREERGTAGKSSVSAWPTRWSPRDASIATTPMPPPPRRIGSWETFAASWRSPPSSIPSLRGAPP